MSDNVQSGNDGPLRSPTERAAAAPEAGKVQSAVGEGASAPALAKPEVMESPISREKQKSPALPGSTVASSVMSEFERLSLRLARLALLLQVLAFAIAVATVVFLVVQVREQTRATDAQTEATNAQYESVMSSVYQDLMSKQLDVDKLFLEKPALYR